MMTSVLVMVFVTTTISSVVSLNNNDNNQQFYQALNPSSFDLNYNFNSLGLVNNNPNTDDSAAPANPNDDDYYMEKKFVNSGQSIVLICDLPNNMPDGKVSLNKETFWIYNSPRTVKGKV